MKKISKGSEGVISQNSLKAMKAFIEISIADRLLNSSEFKEAADRLLQAKVIMLSMLTSEELEFMEKLADEAAKEVGETNAKHIK